MRYTIQLIRSIFFNISMYLAIAVFGIVFTPWVIFSSQGAVTACQLYCRYIMWSARWMIGLHCEVRGTPPTGEVMIAAKHQSFLDVLMIYGAVPRGKFIMKDILKYAPVVGQFGLRVGCIPVKRGQRGQAVKKMINDVKLGRIQPGQLIIYSQGTRIAPGVKAPYKIGTGALYKNMDQPCVPVATNVGVFWPKRGIYRAPGVAVVEFLPPIMPGMPVPEFMAKLEHDVEMLSDALAAEAGFKANG